MRLPILTSLGLALLASTGCGDEPTGPLSEPAEDMVAHGMQHNLTIDGLLLAKIQADSMYRRDGSKAVLLWGPDIDLTPGFPDAPPVLSADQVVINYRTRQLILRGNARIVFPGTGRRFEGEKLRFGLEDGRISADSVSLSFLDGREGSAPDMIMEGFETLGSR
jgi:hypothetical protein